MAVKAQSTISLASVKTVNDASQYALQKANEAEVSANEATASADNAQNALKSVVSGAQTVEKAVSVMQTALEAVVDYDPTTDTTQEYFWHDANGAHVLGATSGYRNDIDSTGMKIVNANTEAVLASFGTETSIKTTNGTELAHFGYAEGQAESSTAIAPYYTLGTRPRLSDVGNYSVAEGVYTTASGYASHAEGVYTHATSYASHAEGTYTHASEYFSHAEGESTIASGWYSHAEGGYTIASGEASHSQNYNTIAQRKSQTALGEYNEADTGGTDKSTRGDYAVIVGNGTADDARSNALTVDWNGNVDIASGASYKIDGTAITDHVIEQGTDGIWTYRKWASGIAECWGRGSASLTSYVHVGSFYGYKTTFAFPSGLFTAVPTHTYTASVGNALTMPASGTSTTATEMAVYALCINSGTQSCVFDMVAKGRWK